jgi:hypothetical protein
MPITRMASVLSCNMGAACIGAIQHDDWLSSFGGSDGEVVKIEANSNLTLTLHEKSHACLKVMG